MLKVAIVDDESLVRVGFQTIINWNEHGYELMGTYRNGLEAWNAFCLEGFPDILLTDIRMPEMDGLELIQKIRETDLEMIILILSSYEEFQYTRRSIQLGVQDYIPKHLFEPEELLTSLNKLNEKRKMKEPGRFEHQNKSELLKAEKKKYMTVTRTHRGIIESLSLFQVSDFPLLMEYMKNKVSVKWIAIREVFIGQSYMESDLSALGYLLQDLMDKSEFCLPIGIDQGIFHGLVFNDQSGKYNDTSVITDLIMEWTETVKQNLAVSVAVGLSTEGELKESKKLRAQAERALDASFFNGPSIFWSHNEMLKEISIRSHWINWQDNFRKLVRSENPDLMFEWMDHVGNEMGGWCSPDESIRLIRWAYNYFLQEKLDQGEFQVVLKQVNHVFDIEGFSSSWTELVTRFKQAIKENLELLQKSLQSKPWLKPVLAYVDEHYAESIRLEDAAAVANLNVNYFSHRFSQEAGMTFLEYLTRVRIREAIKLVRHQQLSAEEAASQVGYPNANYFVKVFKKVTGMTLSEFRKAEQNNLKNWNEIE